MEVPYKLFGDLCLQSEDLRAVRDGNAENVISNNLASKTSLSYIIRKKDGFTYTNKFLHFKNG